MFFLFIQGILRSCSDLLKLFYFEEMFVKLVNIIEWNIVCLLSQQWCIDCKNNEKEGWMPYYENYIYEKIL